MMTDEIFKLPGRKEIIRLQRENGEKIAAVLPIHFPRELLRAFNFHPIEIWGPPFVSQKIGDLHFQSYTCSIIRNATSFLLNGGLEEIDLLVFPHTCDSLQGMASVWIDFIRPGQKIITLYLPKGRRQSDEAFLSDELKRIYQELATITGKHPTDSQLSDQIHLEEEIDQRIMSLYSNRRAYQLNDREFYTMIRAREYLPPYRLLELFDSLPGGESQTKPVRLFLSGIVPEPMMLFDHINKMDGQVVGDDLACCARREHLKMDESDPFRTMAKHLLGTPPCPTRGNSIESRTSYLLKKIQKTQAQGLLIYDPKFCEPELFDVPMIRKKLQKEKIPILHLEIDLGEPLSQQILNRIHAFIELIR